MKTNLESVREILLENRIDDVKKKFPNVDPSIIDYFIKGDPSGNQKYLEWMVKAWTHEPTLRELNNEEDSAAFDILQWVREFHSLLPYMVHTDNGEKEGTTDLYQYKFTDGEMIHYLIYDINQAQKRKNKKEEEKILKKGVDKIFENDGWLIVRPKTHEASCHYGAGTRWCTTTKDTTSHFNRETNRNFLFYVINKNETNHNVLYKVAWQIPFTKNVDEMINSLSFEVNLERVKLWDAEDYNISDDDNPYVPEKYVNSTPITLRMIISNYMKREMGEMYKNVGYNDNPKIQALAEHLDLDQEDVDTISKLEYTNHEMEMFWVESQNEAFAVGSEEDVDRAKEFWAEHFIDHYGLRRINEFIGDLNLSDYLYIENQNQLATELTDSYIKDLNDTEILNLTKDYEYGGTNSAENYLSNLSNIEDIDNDIKLLEKSFQNEEIDGDEYRKELDQLQNDKKQFKIVTDKMFEIIKTFLIKNIHANYIDEMQHPIKWLKDYGWWEDGKPHPKAFDNGIVGIDREALVIDLASGLDLEYFSSRGDYWRIEVAETFYYIFPTDI